MPVVVQKIFGAKQKGKRRVNLLKIQPMQKFNEMPRGWKLDTTWGSPEHGWTPICNGKSMLNGGEKGLLRYVKKEVIQNIPVLKNPIVSIVEHERNDTKVESKDVSYVLQKLARAKFKQALLQEILFDLTVCQIERWPIRPYINELKHIVDSVYKRINKTEGSAKNPSYNKRQGGSACNQASPKLPEQMNLLEVGQLHLA